MARRTYMVIERFRSNGEHDPAQRRAIQCAVRIDDARTEMLRNLRQPRRSRFHHHAGRDIRVDDRDAKPLETRRHGALAAADASGETDDQFGAGRHGVPRC